MSESRLADDQIAALELPDWQTQDETLVANYATKDFATGLNFTNRIGALAEDADHHPDIHLSYDAVEVVLTSHDVGGLTTRDVDLALLISGVAAELGLESRAASQTTPA